MKKFICLLSLLLLPLVIKAQEQFPSVAVSGYVETYLNYASGMPSSNELPSFLYNFNRNNEVNINHSFLQLEVDEERYRGQLALMVGTYANANLADEPGVLQNIYRANVGIKLSSHKNIWLDMGVMDAHIGFESAIGAITQTMTRSILAENSPYYLSGAKLSYTDDSEKWHASISYVNGWQRIQRVQGNSTPAYGHQLTYQPNERWLFNSSSFIGSDFPDAERRMRYFHNFFSQYQASESFFMTIGFDIGAEQKQKASTQYAIWFSPVVIGSFKLSEASTLSGRIELYDDPHQVIVDQPNALDFRVFGWSVNYDHQLNDHILWRIEARNLRSPEALFFSGENNFSRQLFFVGTSLSFYIEKKV